MDSADTRHRTAASSEVRILIADDHPLVCTALSQALQAAMPGAELSTAATLDSLQDALQRQTDLDLVLLDLNMPGARGISSLLWLRSQRPELPVLVISGHDHPRTIARAREFGAAGFLSKSSPLPQLLAAIEAVLRGAAWFPEQPVASDANAAQLAARLAQLTPQQMRVLMGIADGRQNKQIAHELRLAENTVKVHVAAILHKLGCHSRTQAAVILRTIEVDEDAPVPPAAGTPARGAGVR